MNYIIQNSVVVGRNSIAESFYEPFPKLSFINNNIFNDSWWKPSANGKKRIMLCGTYPIASSNGYSKVVYYISKHLAKFEDIELTIYGFQNFVKTNDSEIRNNIPPNVKIHDAFAAENPKRNGFGELEISGYIKENPQDVIIIFNDSIVTSSIASNIVKDCWSQKKNFRLVSYMDQVYPYQKKEYIKLLNTYFDSIVAFTPYWKEVASKLGIKKEMPIYTFPHGFDENLYHPIDMKICRMYYNIDEDAFTVLNLNRNQPRKRWDTTIIAWVEFVEKHYLANVKGVKSDHTNKHTSRPVKLIIGTQMNGFWDINDVIENEVKFRDVPLEYVMKTIHSISMPQQLSDREINILYNACDVGVNSADGEGYGLCGFEGAALGKAQVSANIGGMKEFLNPQCAILINPVMNIYLDNKSRGIAGKAELTNPHDYAEAFWKYFSSPETVAKHGKRSRENILTNYRWESLVEYFYKRVIPLL